MLPVLLSTILFVSAAMCQDVKDKCFARPLCAAWHNDFYRRRFSQRFTSCLGYLLLLSADKLDILSLHLHNE